VPSNLISSLLENYLFHRGSPDRDSPEF
jgi:hypothetical protein